MSDASPVIAVVDDDESVRNALPDPFITSYVRTNTGAGFAFNAKKPFLDLDRDTIGTPLINDKLSG